MVALNKTYQKPLTPDRSAKDSGHRYYSPEISRWLSRDPIAESGSRITSKGPSKKRWSSNLYVAMNNAPADNVDALGLFAYCNCFRTSAKLFYQAGWFWPWESQFYGETIFPPTTKPGIQGCDRVQWVQVIVLYQTEGGTAAIPSPPGHPASEHPDDECWPYSGEWLLTTAGLIPMFRYLPKVTFDVDGTVTEQVLWKYPTANAAGQWAASVVAGAVIFPKTSATVKVNVECLHVTVAGPHESCAGWPKTLTIN